MRQVRALKTIEKEEDDRLLSRTARQVMNKL